MPTIDYSRFYRYEELMALLRGFADENPDYVSLETIGTSHEGRAIPVGRLPLRARGARITKQLGHAQSRVLGRRNNSFDRADGVKRVFVLHRLADEGASQQCRR